MSTGKGSNVGQRKVSFSGGQGYGRFCSLDSLACNLNVLVTVSCFSKSAMTQFK